jgi:hypothetical protein
MDERVNGSVPFSFKYQWVLGFLLELAKHLSPFILGSRGVKLITSNTRWSIPSGKA